MMSDDPAAGPDVTGTSDSKFGVDVVIADSFSDSATSQVTQAHLVIIISSSIIISSNSNWR